MRILFYSHDSYGLGHIRRTVAISTALLGEVPAAAGLVLTGAPRAHYFDYPERCDYIKLPSVTKDDAGRYVSRELQLPLAATVGIRGGVIRSAAASFEPDLVLIDHTPTGLCGEALPLLEQPHTGRRTLRVLGLRDIIDEPSAVRRNWRENGVVDLLREKYDRILVYGQREIFDVAAAYGLPQDIAERIEYTGFVTLARPAGDPHVLRREFAPRTGRLVTVTAGGGGDGLPLMRAALRAYRGLGSSPRFEMLLVSGPLLSPRKRERLATRAAELDGVSYLPYHPDLPALYEASELAVTMAGYNTVCELAAVGARSLLVPRVEPRLEQWVRAEALHRRGLVSRLHPRELAGEGLRLALEKALLRPRPLPGWGLDLNGVARTSHVLARLRMPFATRPEAGLVGREGELR